MNYNEKILLLNQLIDKNDLEVNIVYDILERCGIIKSNYYSYMTTAPINCDEELLRLKLANYDLCCALITMLLREDYHCNGKFKRRQSSGEVRAIIERIIFWLESMKKEKIQYFSPQSVKALNGFYVYALIDPRNEKVFYIGKGTGNRIFSHEIESTHNARSEKNKLKRIREIEEDGFYVTRLIINWGLTEEEAFASEATLINCFKYMPDCKLTNAVSGHHTHKSLTVEQFDLLYGAVPLEAEDIKHSILVIKLTKLYREEMTKAEIYDAVRGFWNASLRSINTKKVKYVFAVHNGIILAVFQPDEWHFGYEMIDPPQQNILTAQDHERLKNRVYFICKDYNALDDDGKFYVNKSISKLTSNKSAQNPITYLLPHQ